MWLPKSIYESLPFYYIALGLLSFGASLYIDFWYWPLICTVVAIVTVVGGLVVWLKRRDYRSSRSRIDFEKTK